MMSTPLLRAAAITAVLAVFAMALPAAADERPTGELGLLGGLVFPDDDIVGHGPDADDTGLGFGLHGNWFLSDHWGIFADGLYAPLDGVRYGDATVTSIRIGPRVFVPTVLDRLTFLVNAGVGYMNVGLDDADSVSRPFLSFGFGQRFRLTGPTALHWELRADRTFNEGDDDTIKGFFGQGEFLVGLGWGFGGESGPVGDADGDGVRDDRDACPNTPRGAKVDSDGCPLDSDGDGVFDGLDKCPDTPKGAKVDRNGCSDADGDGVTDDRDECPDTPEGWPVDSKGCPKDSDRDGVPDGADKCPNTPRGVEVDKDGCPTAAQLFEVDEKTGEIKAFVLEGVNFEFNSDQLTADSRGTLDRVAQSLVAWPDVNVEVGGHTDSQGPADYNRSLSQRRADSVKAYLAGKGVAASRMSTRGYGEDAPVADNGTDAGRAKNRRVELTKTN